MGRPGAKIVLGGGVKSQQYIRWNDPVLCVHELNRAGEHRLDLGFDRFDLNRIQTVGLVQDDKICRKKLVFEDLLQGVLVIERWIGRALPCKRVKIVCEAASSNS